MLLVAELIAVKQWYRRELDKYLGGPTREHHIRADQCLDRIDQLDFFVAEWARGGAA